MAHAGTKEPELQAAFERFDRDRNGHIDEGEFAELIRSLGVDMTPEKVQVAFLAIDVNGNERIDYGEFAAWWGRRTAR
jgi:Ca2+-binding EF-hand superfamily protein